MKYASAIIPARNEELTVGQVVKSALESDLINEVLVIDNGSTDKTGVNAQAAGAKVIFEPQQGMGKAIITGTLAAGNDFIVKVDGDITNPSRRLFQCLAQGLANSGFVKGYYASSYDEFPVANLVA
jgi:glycosyltransferase involved in cell wall biosynthesis